MRPRAWARRVERYCCNTISYFPLLFVYGLTSWAVWVEVGIGLVPAKNAWTGAPFSFAPVLRPPAPSATVETRHHLHHHRYRH